MTDKARAQGRIEAPGRGNACMIGGSLMLSMHDGVVKWVSGDFELGQILVSRGLAVLIIITLALACRTEFHVFQVRYPELQIFRAALVFAGTYLFISGLRLLPLAENVAITFVGPIFVTALAPLVLSEQVGWRRWTAVLVGSVGDLVMLRPGRDGLNWAVLFPAGAALAGVLLCCAHFLHIETFRLAEAALGTPFKYSSLLWAVAIGILAWGDLPDRWTLLGAALLIGSGLYIFYRESRYSAKLTA